MKLEYNLLNAPNRWLVRSFNSIAAIGSIQSETHGEDLIDCIFRNMATRIQFDNCNGFVLDASPTTSVIWVALAMPGWNVSKSAFIVDVKAYHEGVGNSMCWNPNTTHYSLRPPQTCKSSFSLVFVVHYSRIGSRRPIVTGIERIRCGRPVVCVSKPPSTIHCGRILSSSYAVLHSHTTRRCFSVYFITSWSGNVHLRRLL